MGQHDGGLLSPGQLSSSWSGPVPGMAFFAGPEHHHRHQNVPQHRDTLIAEPCAWQPALAPGAGGGGGGASTGLGAGAGTPSSSAAAAAKCSPCAPAGVLSRPGTAEGAGAQARTPRLRCGSSVSTSSNASCGSGGSATALFSPDSAAASRRKVKAGDEGCAQGRWKPEEVAVLLRIAELYHYGELKLIGEVCRFCGLNRPSRAIDKQLKRLLAYDKWSTRNGDLVLEQIRRLLDDHIKLGHGQEISARLAEATSLWPVPEKDDKKLFKARGTDDLAGELFEEDDE